MANSRDIQNVIAARAARTVTGSIYDVPYRKPVKRPAEDLTPEGIQLVIPGAERQQPAGKQQMELF